LRSLSKPSGTVVNLILMNKRLIVILGIIIVILAAVGVLLFLAVEKQRQDKNAAQPLVLKKLLDETVFSPIESFDNNAIWFFNSDARLFRVNLDGSGLSEYPLPALTNKNFSRTLWPASGSDFILVAAADNGEAKNYYNSTKKIYQSLSSNVKNLDWLPDGRRIVYIWQSGTATPQLVTANADGTGFKTIKDVFWPDLQLKAGPDGKTVLMYRTNIEGSTNKIYVANLETAEIGTLIEEGKNLEAKWLPGGKQFIFSQIADGSSSSRLFVFDFDTKQITDLKLVTTLDKVAWDREGKFLYAAVPKQDNSADIFIKQNLSDFTQETYFMPDKVTAARLLWVGDGLYFTNTNDLKFYSIRR
jgi:hypothetical protein